YWRSPPRTKPPNASAGSTRSTMTTAGRRERWRSRCSTTGSCCPGCWPAPESGSPKTSDRATGGCGLISIFSGSAGRCGVGGLAWMNMQYLAGLRALGHDVYYLEECGPESWVYDWEAEQLTTAVSYPAAYVRACLEPLGLDGRWAYRAGDECAG